MQVTLKLTGSECGFFFSYWVYLLGKDKNVLLWCYPIMTFVVSCMSYVAFRFFSFFFFSFLLKGEQGAVHRMTECGGLIGLSLVLSEDLLRWQV